MNSRGTPSATVVGMANTKLSPRTLKSGLVLYPVYGPKGTLVWVSIPD